MVPKAGFEPALPNWELDPESSASANSATSALYFSRKYYKIGHLCLQDLNSFREGQKNMANKPKNVSGNKNIKIIKKNKKAFFNYEIIERFEAGIVLVGTEVKSLREGNVNLDEAYGRIKNGEIWLIGAHISEYGKRGYTNHEPKRKRKLLLHKSEIRKLETKVKERGFTLVPLSIYFKGGLVKVEMGLCKGKKLFDKRDSMKKRDARKEIERALSRKNR